MEAGKAELPVSSAQIQSALDQLAYLQRIVHGDDEMSFSDLVASASASGPSSTSLPLGGLSKALPALLAPLLSSGGPAGNGFEYGTLSQQQGLLAKQAAFQPRRYLAMTADLMARTSDKSGEMHRAIQLAKVLESQSDRDALKQALRQKVLQDRREKKAASDQRQAQADQINESKDRPPNLLQDVVFTSSDVFISALYRQAKQVESNLETKPDESGLMSFLRTWQAELHAADSEASAKVQVAVQQTNCRSRRRSHQLRMRISQTGYAWLWLHFEELSRDAWCARVDRVNVLAESEVEEASRMYTKGHTCSPLTSRSSSRARQSRTSLWSRLGFPFIDTFRSFCRLDCCRSRGRARLHGYTLQ